MDMDGTVYLGKQAIPGAFEALEAIRRSGRRISFLTNNSSRTKDQYIDRLKGFNFQVNEREIYTSTLATCVYLNRYHKGERVFALATPKVQREMAEQGINLVGASHEDGRQEPVQERPDVVVVAFDTSLTYDRLYQACTYIWQGAKYVATHPDDFCPTDGCPMPDMGGFIALIQKTLGKLPDVTIGKPYAPMAKAVEETYGLKPNEIAMVGDRLYTDIRFGVDNGFASVLVLTGETDRQMAEQSAIKPTVTLETFADVLPLLGL